MRESRPIADNSTNVNVAPVRCRQDFLPSMINGTTFNQRQMYGAGGCSTRTTWMAMSMIISWYEQKAVVVLLSLLHLGIRGIRGIRLGPSLPAFITPNVLNVLVETFDLKPIGNSAKGDLEEILSA